MEINIKLSKGTKKADNKIRRDKIEDKIIKKIDKYKSRKERRLAAKRAS